MTKKADFGIDNLLALNGDRYFIDDKGEIGYEEADCWNCQL